MLVLSRKLNQSIEFVDEGGRRYQVRVVRIKGRAVRLGLTAPPGVRIVREEITDDIRPAVAEAASDG